MPKSSFDNIVALPVRFRLNPAALAGLTVQTLEFPFADAVRDFRREAERRLNGPDYRTGKKEYVTPDYRQLNHALLACLPTLTYAFEPFGYAPPAADYKERPRRALSVGTLDSPLRTPTPRQMANLMRAWGGLWAGKHLGKHPALAAAYETLIAGMEDAPDNWGWRETPVESLVTDTTFDTNIGYEAIPALLTTLIHGRKCAVVSAKGKVTEIVWRKAQGLTGERTGLYAVSQPIDCAFPDERGRWREGYFAYRLDFRLRTQAGSEKNGKLQPWVFAFLSCQRYGHEPFYRGNYDRNLTFLLGSGEARIPGYPFDTTLVRLTVEHQWDGESTHCHWANQLPDYIAAFNARRLPEPDDLTREPLRYANWGGEGRQDEFRLVNAEGYYYRADGSAFKHPLEPGYTLEERYAVLRATLDLTGDVLMPDGSLPRDIPTPNGPKTPHAMREHAWFAARANDEKRKDSAAARKEAQNAVLTGIRNAIHGENLHLALLYHNADTKETVETLLRKALFLGNAELPDWLKVTAHFVEGDRLQPLPDRKEQDRKASWDAKYELWLKDVQNALSGSAAPHRIVIAEIGTERKHPMYSIRGAVRAACARAGAASQMALKATTKTQDGGMQYIGNTKHRFHNAILDALLQQTGALLGVPAAIYEKAKIPAEIARNLDVIAFCRRRCNRRYAADELQYALAVRLRADGAVEAMLPESDEWIPYVRAGWRVGKTFFSARNPSHRQPTQLTGPEMARFVERTLSGIGNRPTLALIEARAWRGGGDTGRAVWPQLANFRLAGKCDCLEIADNLYRRDDGRVSGLLGVIRLNSGDESPQYVPNRSDWKSDWDEADAQKAREFPHLSGFLDWSARPLLHYFSIGQSPVMTKSANTVTARRLHKTESHIGNRGVRFDEYAARIPYRHPQMVEMVPFFVREDFASEEGMAALCRVAHYLRSSPAWAMGNLDSPYPMHLGDALIDDQLCILGLGDD